MGNRGVLVRRAAGAAAVAWAVQRPALANPCAAEQDVLRFWRARRTLDCLTFHGPSPSAWRKFLGRAGQVRPAAYGLACERETEVEVPSGVRLSAVPVRLDPGVGEFMANARQPYEGIDLAGEVGSPLLCPECSSTLLVGCSRFREVGGREGDGLAWILESDPAPLPVPLAQHLRVRCHHPGGCPTVSVIFQRAGAAEATGSLPFPERRTNLSKARPGALLPILAGDSSHYRLLSSPKPSHFGAKSPGSTSGPMALRLNLRLVSEHRKPLSRTFRTRQHRLFFEIDSVFARPAPSGFLAPRMHPRAPSPDLAGLCALMAPKRRISNPRHIMLFPAGGRAGRRHCGVPASAHRSG